MTIVFEDLDLPGGGTPPTLITIQLWGAGQPIVGRQISTNKYIGGVERIYPDALGEWSIDLVPNSDILPENTSYKLTHLFGCNEVVSYISVPVSGGPVTPQQIEVDAMNAIAPSLLSVHAADLDLHGGGLEYDYAEIVSAVTVTGSAVANGFVGQLAVTVPDVARPVYLEANVILQALSITVTGNAALAPWDGVTATSGFLGWIDSAVEYPITSNAGNSRKIRLVRRLPPNSPGLYAVSARSGASPWAINAYGDSVTKSWIRAISA